MRITHIGHGGYKFESQSETMNKLMIFSTISFLVFYPVRFFSAISMIKNIINALN